MKRFNRGAESRYTDEYVVYDTLPKEGYKHDRVHHAEEIYVSGDAHTQTIDGFWSLLKRGIVNLIAFVRVWHLDLQLPFPHEGVVGAFYRSFPT